MTKDATDPPRSVNEEKFSIVLKKVKKSKRETEYETLSSIGTLNKLEGILYKMLRILRSPSERFHKKEGQTYHGLRLIK